MYDQAFNTIYKHLRDDEGMSTEMDYAEQTSWVLFLKYLHDLEAEREDAATLSGRVYDRILDEHHSWDGWAMPRDEDDEVDRTALLTGPDLVEFVERDLFPYLAAFRASATGPDTIEYKIGEIFTEVRNRFRSGYTLRDVIDVVDGLDFGTQAQRHELSDLYEQRIKNMGNSGRNGGEYYTPRPVIRAMLKVLGPRIGQTIYDGACGSAGFLCEAFAYLNTGALSGTEWETLQRRTLYGQEKKPLPYVLGVMNMILHGVEAPNLVHANTLAENVMDIGEGDRHDIVLANPPFGGNERAEVQRNFPIQGGETAYMFLQHFVRKLRAGGSAGIVIKNTFLTNGDATALRRELLDRCDLHTVLDLPAKAFPGAGVKTVVLFFRKGAPTRSTWYYQLDPGRSLGKTNPLNDADMAEFVAMQATRAEGPQAWTVRRGDLDEETLDLGVRNPHAPEAAPERAPAEIIDAMLARDAETAEILRGLRAML